MKQNSNNWKNESQEDDFYRELDEKKQKNCCTCQTLSLLFAFLLVVVAGVIFYLYWQITRGGVLHLPSAQTASAQDFNEKLQNPQVSGTDVILILTSDELNAGLNNGFSINNFVLKDINLSINPKEILIYGNSIKPINSKVVIVSVPAVENGKIKLQVSKASAGNINMPGFINQKISQNLNTILDNKMAQFYDKCTVNNIQLDQNKIIINGKIK